MKYENLIGLNKGNNEEVGRIVNLDNLNKEESLEIITKLEEVIFPEPMRFSPDIVGEIMAIDGGIHLAATNDTGEYIGYALASPLDKVIETLKEYDPALAPENKSLYIETFGTAPEERSLANLQNLVKELIIKARSLGYDHLSMHVRKVEGLSDFLQSRMGAEFKHEVENWMEWGETFDYLELYIGK